MFLKLEGIEGESVDKTHAKEIQVLAWSWGVTQSGSTHESTGSGSGKVNVQDLSFTKYIDKSTLNLFRYACKGKHIASGILMVRKAGDNPLEYLKLSLKDIIVASVQTGDSGGEDRLTESVTLNFGKFKIEYQSQKSDGSGKPEGEFPFDIPVNAEQF
jgi:type VI secretion system secreted protein Hcp